MTRHHVGIILRIFAWAAMGLAVFLLWSAQHDGDVGDQRAGCLRTTSQRWEEVLVLRKSAHANFLAVADEKDITPRLRAARLVEARTQLHAARVIAPTTRPTEAGRRAFCAARFG